MVRKLLLLLLIYSPVLMSQQFYMEIKGNQIAATKTIDSIGYTKANKNVASLLAAKANFENKLTLLGYFENKLLSQQKTNDSTFLFTYALGKPTKNITISFDLLSAIQKEQLNITKDSLSLSIGELESWMNNHLKTLENKGYSLTKLNLINYQYNNSKLTASLNLELQSIRKIDDIKIQGSTSFPKNIAKNINKKFKNKTFNKALVQTINNNFEQFPFITQTKYPEILFTTDSTKVFVYIEKTKPNKFDGYIGFANNDEGKLVFNGYLDLALQNVLNSGEKFNLYWKNDGNDQTSFNLGSELPYLFKSPLGIKANLQIFKKDSTFQNTQRQLNIGYYFSYNKKVFLGYQGTTSADIQNSNSFSINNFKNNFITSTFDYYKRNNESLLFPEKTNIMLKLGIGSRTITTQKESQFFTELQAQHLFALNSKNSIQVKNQTLYLESPTYLTNELFRFGGINSIRGFRENSLQGNFFSAILAEYRYQLASSIYMYSITDYGFYQDKSTNTQNNLLGLGFGFGLITNNGLLNLVYANGSTKNQAIEFSNSIVQLSFKTSF